MCYIDTTSMKFHLLSVIVICILAVSCIPDSKYSYMGKSPTRIESFKYEMNGADSITIVNTTNFTYDKSGEKSLEVIITKVDSLNRSIIKESYEINEGDSILFQTQRNLYDIDWNLIEGYDSSFSFYSHRLSEFQNGKETHSISRHFMLKEEYYFNDLETPEYDSIDFESTKFYEDDLLKQVYSVQTDWSITSNISSAKPSETRSVFTYKNGKINRIYDIEQNDTVSVMGYKYDNLGREIASVISGKISESYIRLTAYDENGNIMYEKSYAEYGNEIVFFKYDQLNRIIEKVYFPIDEPSYLDLLSIED